MSDTVDINEKTVTETATESDTQETQPPTDIETKPTRAKKPTAAQVRGQIVMWILLLLSGMLRAVSIHSFINPNHFAPGGVTGVATMLNYSTGWNAGIFLFAFNIPLLIVAFFFISKMFTLKTGVSLAVSSLALMLFEKIDFFTYTDERILAAVAGGLLGGAGLAVLFKTGGSSGGTDIIATIIQRKYKAAGVSWFIFALDSVVVIASFFVYDFQLSPVLLAFVEMFVSARACDFILNGFKSAVKFEVITTHADEISAEILAKLHRGVTKVEVTGMYSHDEKALLICIVRRRQIAQFQKIIRAYPDTFAYTTSTSEVFGRGFQSMG